jgi:hypothetical protein
MSTHSFIGYETDSGRVLGVYCHFDGYLDGVGAVLKEHYTDLEKVKELIALGSLSSLGPSIGEKHDFNDDSAYSNGWTTAYHRDRGEPLSIAEYDDMYSIEGAYEYMYVFTKMGLWMHRNDFVKAPWLPLI